MNGIESIAAERRRQIGEEGWTPEHDDQYEKGQLLQAAICYIIGNSWSLVAWPWAIKWWKPKDRRRDLVRAGALIAAEIDRLDREALSERETKA